MRKLILLLLTTCTILFNAGCSNQDTFHHQDGYTGEFTKGGIQGDVGDESLNSEDTVDFDSLQASDYPKCSVKNSGQYSEDGPLFTMYHIYFRPTKILITVRFHNLAHEVKSLKLRFKLDDGSTSSVIVNNVFSGCEYRLLIDRRDSNYFTVKSCSVVDFREPTLGDYQEFDSSLELKGTNTLICHDSGTYQLYDRDYCSIDYRTLKSGSKTPITFGAKYYRKEEKE